MQLVQTLQDIASYVQIESSKFRINHSDFPPIEIPMATVAQVKKMSQEVQDKCLNLQVLELIYHLYYEGSLVREASQGVKTNDQILQKVASVGVDWEFYEQLDRNNQSKGWFHPNFRVLRQEADGSLAVEYDRVTVHIQRDRHLQLAEQLATVDDVVSILMPSSFIEKDLYIAIGEASHDAVSWKNYSNQKVLVYFNFSPEAAIAAMKCVTTRLNAIKEPFTFKVLYNPLNYRRYDSGILQFSRTSYELVRQVLQAIYAENKSHFQPQVPLFTKVLAPGIGLAEDLDPEVQFRFRETFGQNRCQIVANALLEAHQNGDQSPEARMTAICKHFDLLGIDLERPYLNPNSEDIYTPLD
jgi:hypothetical protein